MEVTVRHAGTGNCCVIGVPSDGTVRRLKMDALEAMFVDSIVVSREAAGMVARIEGCEANLDDAERIADTGLEEGGSVQLVPGAPQIAAPALYPPRPDAAICSIVLSKCARLCVVGDEDGGITIFDTIAAAEVASLTHGSHAITYTAFSACGTWLAASSVDGIISVWLTSKWTKVHTIRKPNEEETETSVAWTHCDRLITGCASGDVIVWDLGDGTPSSTVLEGHHNSVSAIAVSETRFYTASEDSTIGVWSVDSLTRIHTLSEHTQGVSGVAVTDTGSRLVSCDSKKVLKVWCTESLTCLCSADLKYYPFSIAVSEPGDIVAVACNPSTMLHRLSTGECLRELDSEGDGLALSPCGRWVFLPTRDHAVSVEGVEGAVSEEEGLTGTPSAP